MANVNSESDSTMSEKITPIWNDLVSGLLYVEYFAEQLEITGTLSRIQVEEIKSNENPLEKKRKLLNFIRMRGAYDIFSHCLHVSGQDELYQLMVSVVRVPPVTDELTTLQYRVLCQHGIGNPRKLQVPPHLSDRLEKQREALQVMTNVERLVDLMEEEGCLTREVTIAIRDQSGDKEKTNMLIDNVKKSTLYSFFLLTRFLDISQQKPLMSKITEEDTKTALGRMDDLLLDVYYNLLGGIALKESELEERLGIKARDFVSLCINRNSKVVDRKGLDEAQVDRSPGSGIELTELFSGTEGNKPVQKVLLIGAPGAGKTTAVMELARQATAKKIPTIPHPPFVIQLRKVGWGKQTTLKNLLLGYGPKLTTTEQEEVWRALSMNATEVTVILDGADEVPGGFFNGEPAPVEGEESQAHPEDILNNVIFRDLFKEARVLVTSRPFGLEKGWSKFARKVEVIGFSEKSLNCFLINELPGHHLELVQKFLSERVDIRSLLLTPLYAASFVLKARRTEASEDLLLQSRTELSLSVIDSLVRTKLLKDGRGMIDSAHLRKQGRIVRKLGKLIAGLLVSDGAIKIEMTEEDLEEVDLNGGECIGTGLFIKKVIVDDERFDSIFEVPHQSILESLAAIGLEESQIQKLVADNDGRYDLIITYVAGIMAKEKNRKMFEYILSKEDKKKDFMKLTKDVVSGVLGSKRRALRGGKEFCMRIVHESQQWSFIGDLKRVMGRWLWSDSSETLMAADQLLRQDPGKDKNDPLVRVQVGGIRSVKYCPRATALTQHGEVTTAAIEENAQHLHNIVSVSFSWTGITRKTVAGVAEQLSRLHKLEAVSMEDNIEVSSSSDESSALGSLSLIPSLHYLCLSGFRLTSADVSAITSSCECLQHLDISGNRGLRGGDVESRQLTGLSVMGCRLNGDELVELVTRNGQTLKFLNAFNYNNVLSSSHINDILTRCPRLVEMYVSWRGGGELVRALSERRAVCLKHLWLSRCDFSSSSSSSNQVNSSELRDVLTRHSSISSLTLFRCRHFTSEFMRLLSSSMASVTSLFISPHPHRPHPPPLPSDVASLVHASPSLTQLWLDDISGEWHASDYIAVVHAVNASPAPLSVVGLGVRRLSVDDVRVVVRSLTRRLTRLWLWVDREKMKEMAEVVMEERELGVVHLVYGLPGRLFALYYTYQVESGSFYQHLPPSLPDDFRPGFFF